MAHDVFGRERHATERSDGGGTGSFSKENRTLLITELNANMTEPLDDVVRRNFAVLGPIEYVRTIQEKSMAFVRYQLRASAEFAKVAMHHQTLDGETVSSC